MLNRLSNEQELTVFELKNKKGCEDKPDWEKMFAKDISDKRLLTKTYKEFLKHNSKKMNNVILKWAKDLNRHLIKEDMQIVNKHIQKWRASHVIKQLQIKTRDTTTHLLEWPKSKTLTVLNTDENVE